METKLLAIIILILYGFIGNLANDIYLPILPLMEKVFCENCNTIQFTYSIWFLGSTLGQLPAAILMSKYNRMHIFLSSGILFAIATCMCALSTDINLFIIARFMQGLSFAAYGIFILPEIYSNFEGENRKKILALSGILGLMSPPLGPVLGSYLSREFSWHLNFYFIGFSALALIIASLMMVILFNRDKLKAVKSDKKFTEIFKEYFNYFTNVKKVLVCACPGIVTGSLVAYLVLSPSFLITHYGLSKEDYSLYQFFILGFYILGLFLFAVRKVSSLIKLPISSSLIILIGGITLVVARFLGIESLYFYLSIISSILLSIGFICNFLLINALSKMPDKTIGATLIGIFTALGCWLFSTAISIYPYDKVMLLGMLYIICALAVYYITRNDDINSTK